MNSVAEIVGAALPLAVAVALSPLPVIALALLLTSRQGAPRAWSSSWPGC
ncbi:hypothetical protein NKG05_11785 [Oerskovia sp. M15]